VEDGSEVVIFEAEEPVAEEIVEDAVGPHWYHLSEEDVVIVFSFQLGREGIEGLIDLDKLGMSGFVVGVILGVILEGKFAVGDLDLLKSGGSGDAEGVVVVGEGVWVVLVEELLLLLVDQSVLVEEALEGRVSVLQRVLLAQEFIVVGTLVPVREHLEGLRNLMKLGLCTLSVLLVFVGVPHGGEAFVGAFDFEEGGVFRDAEDGVVVLEGLL
jgi:hypothetical protein